MPKSTLKTDSKESLAKHLYVLILAGGGGTRLWPLSREHSPKQFLKLFEGRSLFALTLERARKLVRPERIFVSTSAKYVAHVKSEAKWLVAENIIAEPLRRDTALAMGLGALYIHQRDPQAIIINLASDHLIRPLSAFVSDMRTAARLAGEKNQVVTVGIRPRFPHPGMGHIQTRGLVGVKFIEKPPLPQAKKYTASRNYFWNANLYVWPAKLFLDLLKKHAPKTTAQFPAIAKAVGLEDEKEVLQRAFQMAPTISVDYAVSEKLTGFICLPATFGWTDVGDWSEVMDNEPQTNGNVILASGGRGQYIGLNSRHNLLVLDRQLVATVGIKDLLIIDTPDAILICNIADDQAVKQVHQMLKEQGLTKYL